MEVKVFIHNFREAFGVTADLPFVFWYSDNPISEDIDKINGCFFKSFDKLKEGEQISLSSERIGCMGGKFYTGFSEMHERIPNFVSLKEKYKKTPEMVIDFIQKMKVPSTDKIYLNISPVDKIDSFDNILGIIFFATPDVLSGLASWTFFDNNADDLELSNLIREPLIAKIYLNTSAFDRCSSIFTDTVVENSNNGRRTFLGLFDPSVRRYIEPDILSFAIPMSRFKEMYYTMRDSCLFDTPAWSKVRNRINGVIE